jgi:hypothetical protein
MVNHRSVFAPLLLAVIGLGLARFVFGYVGWEVDGPFLLGIVLFLIFTVRMWGHVLHGAGDFDVLYEERGCRGESGQVPPSGDNEA